VPTLHAQINVTWNGGAGFWGDATNWSSDPTVPNSDQFDVKIDSGNATVSTVTVGMDEAFAAGSLDIDADDSLNLQSGPNLTIGKSTSSTISNTGNINLSGGRLSIRNEVMLAGGGNVTLGLDENRISFISSDAACVGHLINVDNRIGGSGAFGDLDFTNFAAGIVEPSSAVPGAISGMFFQPRNVVNRGTIRTDSESFISMSVEDFDNTGGLIEATDDAGTAGDLSSGIGINAHSIYGGTLRSEGTAVIVLNGSPSLSSQERRVGNLTFDGTIRVDSGNLALEGGIENHGTLTVQSVTFGSLNGGLRIDTSAELSGGGTVNLLGTGIGGHGVLTNVDNTIQVTGSLEFIEPTISNEAAGVIATDHDGCLVAITEFLDSENHGTLSASNGGFILVGDITNFGTIQVGSGSSIVGILKNEQGGSLVGDGVIAGDTSIGATMVLDNSGRIAPGASVGHLTIEAPMLSLSETSLLEIEIDSSGADLLTVFGDLLLGGELQISLLAGFTPVASDIFPIIDLQDPDVGVTATLSGMFTGIADGGTVLTSDGRGTFLVDYTDSGVFLTSFVAIPEPGSAGLLTMIAGLAALRRTRRKK